MKKRAILWGIVLGTYYLLTVFISTRIRYGFPIKNLSLFVFSDGWINYSAIDLLKDIVVNIITYMPIGYMCVKLMHHNVNISTKYFISVSLGCALSVIKEVVQLLTSSGCCDVNDIFFNVVGTVLGVILCVLLITVRQKK